MLKRLLSWYRALVTRRQIKRHLKRYEFDQARDLAYELGSREMLAWIDFMQGMTEAQERT